MHPSTQRAGRLTGANEAIEVGARQGGVAREVADDGGRQPACCQQAGVDEELPLVCGRVVPGCCCACSRDGP